MITIIVAAYVAMFANLGIRLWQETDAKLEITLIKGFLIGAQAQSFIGKDEEGVEDPSVQLNVFQIGFGFLIFTLTYLIEE